MELQSTLRDLSNACGQGATKFAEVGIVPVEKFAVQYQLRFMSGFDNRLEPFLHRRLEGFAAARVHCAVGDQTTPTVQFLTDITRITELRGIVNSLGFHLCSKHFSFVG
jgi:hypothetical protein